MQDSAKQDSHTISTKQALQAKWAIGSPSILNFFYIYPYFGKTIAILYWLFNCSKVICCLTLMNINSVQINIYCSDWSLKIIHWLNTHPKGFIHNTSLFVRYWKGLKEQVVHLQLRSFVVCPGNINRRLIQSDNPGLGASPNFLISTPLSLLLNQPFIHSWPFVLQICTVPVDFKKSGHICCCPRVFSFVKTLGVKQGGFNCSSLPAGPGGNGELGGNLRRNNSEWSQPGRKSHN